MRRELQAGTIVQIGNIYFWRQAVVYTGIDINKLNRIDQQSSSFTADFYLWFRYVGDAGPNDIEFPGATNLLPQQPLFDPTEPIKSFQTNGVNYRLYKVQGEFNVLIILLRIKSCFARCPYFSPKITSKV